MGTHMSALRSLITSHLILITATPLSGTLKSGMVRWVPRSAAGTESGRRGPSARRTHQSLILITATPLSGTLKSGMVRWAQECCWYGKWEKKSKCEKNRPVTHPDNCYSSIWNTEIRHGEMGAKKCCWYGDWKRKSKCNGGHKDG